MARASPARLTACVSACVCLNVRFFFFSPYSGRNAISHSYQIYIVKQNEYVLPNCNQRQRQRALPCCEKACRPYPETPPRFEAHSPLAPLTTSAAQSRIMLPQTPRPSCPSPYRTHKDTGKDPAPRQAHKPPLTQAAASPPSSTSSCCPPPLPFARSWAAAPSPAPT